MHQIEMNEISEAFFPCWQAAGQHLSKQVDGGIRSWLRADPYPPFLEHLSFRLGNQLFFIRVEDADGRVIGPGNSRGLITVASIANGHACVLRMKKMLGGSWVAELPGWGLLDAGTGKPIDPVALVTDQKIEMTPWEVHDVAIQIVRSALQKEGLELMSWQANPAVDPSIWFIGRARNPEWVVVRAVRYPERTAPRPANWQAIAAGCARMSTVGHFASVALVSADQDFGSGHAAPEPLWRGHPMHIRYAGLE